jgi:hypothetical protein
VHLSWENLAHIQRRVQRSVMPTYILAGRNAIGVICISVLERIEMTEDNMGCTWGVCSRTMIKLPKLCFM